MTNRKQSSNTDVNRYNLATYIDPQIILDFPCLKLSKYNLTSQTNSKISFLKKDDKLVMISQDGTQSIYPYYFQNLTTLLSKTIILKNNIPLDSFDSLIKMTQLFEKKIFSKTSLNSTQNFKGLWDEIIKKINLISNESQSLSSLMEKLLEVPFLKKFESSLLILHLKGQTKAKLVGVLWRKDKTQSQIEVKEFNIFFNSIKKSKIKSFSTEAFPFLDLPFNGTFLAKETTSKKYSLVAITSRLDFLNYSKEEIELFETCIDLLQKNFERLIDQEFYDKQISELRSCLKDFPVPIKIKNISKGSSFVNDLFTSSLQDKDVFFTKNILSNFSIDLYDCDDLRHYAFDLFHFQRISLLGDLLNTLRHELSNPLFGLKLGSDILEQMQINFEDKVFMPEIQKNISRCQVIIENFSNLYQIQNDIQTISLKKIIDESILLTKSESRGIIKKIEFLNDTLDIEIKVPGIFVIQILFNLIVNACQAMRDNTLNPELKILISRSSGNIIIDVIDSGPNVSHDKSSLLFKPFFTTKTQGTGLGLVLSRNLAIKMGGNLEYLMNNHYTGAHFRLILPNL